MVPYLGELEYYPLREVFIEALLTRSNVLEELGYFNLLEQRQQFYVDSGYEQLQAEYNAKMDELGIPRKIDLAKLAARTLLDLSRLDETAGRRVSVVALVIFSNDSVLLQELTPNLDAVEGKILQLEPQYQTNIYDALEDALQELERNRDPAQPSLVILLSDGHANVGPGPEQILADIPPWANELDIPICTVGIGQTEAHVDRNLLRGLAEETGGRYLFARTGEELVNFFVACRQEMVGAVTQYAGYLRPGQPSPLEPVPVSPNVCELSLALNFIAGDPDLEITDPQGVLVEAGYPGFTLQKGVSLKLFTLLTPTPGEWRVTVTGGDAVVEEIFYNVVITSNLCQQTSTPTILPTPYLTRTPLPSPGVVEQTAPVIPILVVVLVVFGGFVLVTLMRP